MLLKDKEELSKVFNHLNKAATRAVNGNKKGTHKKTPHSPLNDQNGKPEVTLMKNLRANV